jgi:hypothetical protein
VSARNFLAKSSISIYASVMYDPDEVEDLTEVRKLYPTFTDEELMTAKTNLRRYAEALLRIDDRLQLERKSLNDLQP